MPADDEQAELVPDAETGSGEPVRPRLIPGTDQTEGEIPATPQDEADVQQTVDKALRMIHGRQSRDQILKTLHNPEGTVAQTVGKLTFDLLMTVSKQKEAGGGAPLSEDVLREAAAYVVPELLKVGCAAGIFPFDDPDNENPGEGNDEFNKQVRLAMAEAVKVYGEQVLKSPNAEQRS